MTKALITRQQRRHIERENAKQPCALTEVPPELWPNVEGTAPIKVFRSNRFWVQVYLAGKNLRLSIGRTELDGRGDWKDGITWDELQGVKRELGMGDYYAIEVYPRDKDIVNVANIRHLWVLEDPLDIGWVKP